jgi:hypothetical protein
VGGYNNSNTNTSLNLGQALHQGSPASKTAGGVPIKPSSRISSLAACQNHKVKYKIMAGQMMMMMMMMMMIYNSWEQHMCLFGQNIATHLLVRQKRKRELH